jgi:hypothetical protein
MFYLQQWQNSLAKLSTGASFPLPNNVVSFIDKRMNLRRNFLYFFSQGRLWKGERRRKEIQVEVRKKHETKKMEEKNFLSNATYICTYINPSHVPATMQPCHLHNRIILLRETHQNYYYLSECFINTVRSGGYPTHAMSNKLRISSDALVYFLRFLQHKLLRAYIAFTEWFLNRISTLCEVLTDSLRTF